MPDDPPLRDPALLSATLSEDERDRQNAAQIEHALTRRRRRHRSVLALAWGVILICALAAIWKLASTWVAPVG
jgi:hypothetical protein